MKKFLGLVFVLAVIGGLAFVLADEDKRKKILEMVGL